LVKCLRRYVPKISVLVVILESNLRAKGVSIIMHEKAAFVFWLTLILYIITLIFVTYVGVYLTYVTIPLIVVSGLVMKLTKPSKEYQENVSKVKSAITEISSVTESALNETNKALDSFSSSLEAYNRKTKLIRDRTEKQRNEINQLKLKKIEPEIHLKYAKSIEEKEKYQKIITIIDIEIKLIEKVISEVEKECEIQIAKSLG